MMKNGYYLSLYAHIDELVHLTQINLRHDQNMALWHKSGDDIELVHYWEFERVSGLKHHALSFYNREQAIEVINKLLAEYNLSFSDMLEVWGTPGLSTSDDYHSLDDYPEFPYHIMAHLASSVFLDTDILYNNTILALAMDAGPDNVVDHKAREKNYYVGGVFRQGIPQLFPVSSPGLLWLLMRLRYKMEEGSLMALGSASTSEAYIPIDEVVPIFSTTDILKAHHWLNNIAARIESFSRNDEGKLFNHFDGRFSEIENKISMIVKIIQEVSIRMMEQTIRQIIDEQHLQPDAIYLAVSGGFALNCPCNSYLMKKFKFKGFIAPPCINDGGLALGIGLLTFYLRALKADKKMHFKLKNAYYGGKNADGYLEKSPVFIKEISPLEYNQMIEDTISYPVIWFNDRAEIGPRALGNRSILGDPRSPRVKEILNEVKQRQWWRPVAPIIIKEYLEEWFQDAHPSPFMLHAFHIRPDKKNLVPAILHHDDSARIQTLDAADNILLYNVLNAFYEKTGVPILCNTSLNDKGEPIIETVDQAINFCLRKKIPIAYINGKRIVLHNHESYNEKFPLPRENELFEIVPPQEKDNYLSKHNPFNLPLRMLTYYYNNPLLFTYSLKNQKDIQSLERIFTILKKQYADQYDFKDISDVVPLWDLQFTF
ncbi:MAG: carbamoyltransferase [Acidobacteria bacterium]|jgi:hypothetical protein|nr:carbamoyltransferase [Acidobacteriota bacterium]